MEACTAASAAATESSLGEASISVSTLSGATHVVNVPAGATAAAVRAAVAAAVAVPMIEVGLLDNATGEKMHFGSAVPLARLPSSLTFIRSKRWACVPEGCHHPKLTIEEDGAKVSVREHRGHQGFFLSEPLEPGRRYLMNFQLEGTGYLYIGATRDDATKWDYIPGVFFYFGLGMVGSYVEAFTEWREASHDETMNRELLDSCCMEPLTIVVDTAIGGIELQAKDGAVVATHKVPQLAYEHSLRFCASMSEVGQCLTILDASAE